MTRGRTIGDEAHDAAVEAEAERLVREQGQDRSEADDVEYVEVDDMEFWDFEILFETVKFVEDRLPKAPEQIKTDLINEIYYMVREAHERESAEKEG